MNKLSVITRLRSIPGRALSYSPGRILIDPRFLIIGGQRCGTTSLFHDLNRHPNIVTPTKKEINYFSTNYEKGYDWYRRHFVTERKNRHVTPLISGEASPYYMLHPHAPALVKERIPDIKLIALLREPGERAFSHYKYHVKEKVEDLTFEEAINAESERLAGEWEKMLQDREYDSYGMRMFSYLARGRYVDHLEHWLKHFSLNQILILQSEDYFLNPKKNYLKVQDFLGLPAYRPDSFQHKNSTRRMSMGDEVRQYLTGYFKPFNDRLFELLGESFPW